jgi:hypothetical protein
MSIQEYSKQRKYANSFETIDPSKIEHKAIDTSDLEKVLDIISGEKLDLEEHE